MFEIDWWFVTIIVILFAGFIAFIVWRIVDTYRHQVTAGREDLIGKTAEVKETLKPEGTVFYQGDLWTAVSSTGRIEIGEEVIISGVDGLKLIVTKKVKE